MSYAWKCNYIHILHACFFYLLREERKRYMHFYCFINYLCLSLPFGLSWGLELQSGFAFFSHRTSLSFSCRAHFPAINYLLELEHTRLYFSLIFQKQFCLIMNFRLKVLTLSSLKGHPTAMEHSLFLMRNKQYLRIHLQKGIISLLVLQDFLLQLSTFHQYLCMACQYLSYLELVGQLGCVVGILHHNWNVFTHLK